MASSEFKANVDRAVEIIVSCWDENNPDSDKTFDERLMEKIEKENNNNVRKILINSMEMA